MPPNAPNALMLLPKGVSGTALLEKSDREFFKILPDQHVGFLAGKKGTEILHDQDP